MAKTDKTSQTRRSGIAAPVPVARAVRSVASQALGKVGQSFAQLMTHWPQVVGPELAMKCLPTALNFPRGKNADAVLHLATNSAFALELSHQTPLIMERVNSFLGYRAIAELRFDHKQLPFMEYKVVTAAVRGVSGQVQAPPATMARPDSPISAEVCQIYSEIKDPELREKLESLCRAVASAA
jgi:hypothetical protein